MKGWTNIEHRFVRDMYLMNRWKMKYLEDVDAKRVVTVEGDMDALTDSLDDYS